MSPPPTTRSLLTISLLALLSTVPFLAKPLHVDDPLFVWAARQVAAHPLDPYGFGGNWAGFAQPFWRFMQNPPLAFYWLAAVGRVAGWGELSLHAGLLPWSVLAAVGTYRLAALFCRRPLLAAVLAVASPAFVVSATTLMCDVPMLCLWVWTVDLWVRGSAADSLAMLAAAAALAAAAVLTKYPAIDLVPLLLAHAVLCPARHRRTRVAQAVALAVPVAALVAWNDASAHLYGVGLVADASAYAGRARAAAPLSPFVRALDTLCFVGGGCLPAALVAVVGRRSWPRRAVVLAMAVALSIVAASTCKTPPGWRAAPFAYFAQYGVQATLGVALLAACWAGATAARAGRPDRPGLFLVVWIVGVAAFAAAVNWSVNARSVLPLLPAACILTVRATDAEPRRVAWAIGLAAAVSVWVTTAEYRVAVANRDAAFRLATRRTWFAGHWGFQYYMERRGARPLDAARPTLSPGDAVVLPLDNDAPPQVPPGVRIDGRLAVGGTYWVTTMNDPTGGGFYASYGDRLPFVIGPIPAEEFLVGHVADRR